MPLSENERRVYERTRAHARRGHHATIDEISRETGVARSSVARTAKSLGYHGWQDFVTQLVEYHCPEKQTGSVSRTVGEIAGLLEGNRGRLILIDAVGDAEICVNYMLLRLGELGFNAALYSVGILEGTGAETGGVLLVLNESGMTLLPSCLNALAYGFKVVAITASHDTPVSKVADVNVVIKNHKSTLEDYAANLFPAGALALLERVMAKFTSE